MFVTSISFRGTFKSFWDLTDKSAILVKSAFLWISQPNFQNQSIEGLALWRQKKKKVCWSVLECVLPVQSLLFGKCVEVCCSALQCVAVHYNVAQCVAMNGWASWHSQRIKMQCVAVCCSTLQSAGGLASSRLLTKFVIDVCIYYLSIPQIM